MLALSLFGVGCGDEPAAPVETDFEMVYWSGDGQVGPCYSELLNPVVVRILDGGEVPVAGQTVEFGVVQGDGSVRHGTATSNDDGFATEYWTVGAPGPQVLEVHSASPRLTGEFARFTAVAEWADVGERRITTDLASATEAAICGDRIVWVGPGGLHMYDLASETESRITTDEARPSQPAIDGDRVVWKDSRNGRSDIYLYDLVTQTERRITADEARPSHPAIDGDRIVWNDTRNGSRDIYLYDLVTETERQITGDVQMQRFPAIDGDRIVWLELRNGDYDIYLYDLATETEQRLTTDTTNAGLGESTRPSISGGRVVWVGSGVRLYDIAAGTERRITTEAALVHSSSPAKISGDRIVWYDLRDTWFFWSQVRIYLYDLANQTERRIGANPYLWGEPYMSGERIVWSEERNRDWGVYVYDLATACIPPDP